MVLLKNWENKTSNKKDKISKKRLITIKELELEINKKIERKSKKSKKDITK